MSMAHPYRAYVNPPLAELLERLRLDKRFVRGQGSVLTDAHGVEYLDFVSAYGALPFGHNPPEIWNAVHAMHARGEPSMTQPSYLEAAGELAGMLVRLAPEGLRYVTLANSGAEAIEAAIKACRSTTGREGLLATWDGFHGKTLGALSATGKAEYQQGFFAPAPGFDYVPYGDPDALEAKLATEAGRFAAFVVEPVQGEAGVVVPPPDYLRRVRELCTRYDVLLVLDEVQTGLGRTGRLFAAEHAEVSPDVLTLAKALGGGLVPAAAALFNERSFNTRYALKHSSTFAGNTLAARVAIQVLYMLTENGQARIAHVRAMGAYLRSALEGIAGRYPDVLPRVRGIGLMIGLEFGISRDSYADRDGSLLGFLGETEALTPLISSYLLNVENVRVAPTLNGKRVIRVQPALDVTPAACDRLVAGVARVCAILDAGRTDELVGHLVGRTGRSQIASGARSPDHRPRRQIARPGDGEREGRFAFLVHLLDDRSYREFDSSLDTLVDLELAALSERCNGIVEPAVIGSTRVAAASGATAYGEFIAIQRTAAQIKAMGRAAVPELQAALELARTRGARIIGLGGFTSVVSQGGRLLASAGVPLTTGNSFTTVAAMDATRTAAARLELTLGEATVAVVGAGGSIGSAVVRLLGSEVGELILVGNPKHVVNTRFRLGLVVKQTVQRLRRCETDAAFEPQTLARYLLARPDCPARDASDEAFLGFATQLIEENGAVTPLRWTVDCDAACAASDVVVTATSATEALIRPEVLKHAAIVCDVSRPANVDASLIRARRDVLVIDGGVIAVPGLPDLGWSFGFPRGIAYACMCETMMLALERRYEHASLGADLDDVTLDMFAGLARNHGFAVAELSQFGKPITASEWDGLLAARRASHVAD